MVFGCVVEKRFHYWLCEECAGHLRAAGKMVVTGVEGQLDCDFCERPKHLQEAFDLMCVVNDARQRIGEPRLRMKDVCVTSMEVA